MNTSVMKGILAQKKLDFEGGIYTLFNTLISGGPVRCIWPPGNRPRQPT